MTLLAAFRSERSLGTCGTLLVICLFLLSGEPIEASQRVTPTVLVRDEEATLFAFDDVSIPFAYNLYLSMHQPRKHPDNPVLPLGEPGDPDEWQHRYYGTVIRHQGKFKMWYVGASREGFITPELGGGIDFRGWRFLYAESRDGVHWEKPDLGLVEFRGNRNNNLVLMPEGFRGYHIAVVHEPEDPDPSRRFKALVLLRSYGEYSVPHLQEASPVGWSTRAINLPLYSADGLRWRVADELVSEGGKTISADIHLVTDVEGAGLYRWQGMYYLSGQGQGSPAVEPYGRHLEIFRSPDLIHWSRSQTMGFAREGQFQRPPSLGKPLPNEQTHEGASVWNRGNVLIGITGFWHGAKDWTQVVHPLGFLVSNDGLHFREPIPDFIFAEIGEDGRDWDEGGLSQGQGFENVGEMTYVWYGQMDQRMGPRTGRPWERHGGIGLLLLGRDRFGSLSLRDPDEKGILVTSDLELQGPSSLWVNAEGVGPHSSLKLELVDHLERPLPGYSGEGAAVVEQSGLRVPVKWSGESQIQNPKQPFKIRVTLQGREASAIRLYAFYVSPGQQ